MLYDHKIGLIVDKKVTHWVEGACIVFWSVFALWTRYFGKVLRWAFFVLFCAVGVLLDVQLWCTIEEWDCVVRYCCVVCGAYWWHWVVVSLCGTVGSCSVQSSRFCDGQGMDRRQTRRAQTVTAGWTGPVILLKAQTVFLHCVFSTGVVFSLTFHHCGFSMCYCWMNRTGHIAQGSNYLLAVCNRKQNQKNHFVF